MGPPGLQISERKSSALVFFNKGGSPELRSQLFKASVEMQSRDGLIAFVSMVKEGRDSLTVVPVQSHLS